MSERLWTYSFSDELWTGEEMLATREEAIHAGREVAKRDGCNWLYTGKRSEVEIPAPNGWHVIEDACENVFEQVGEVSEGWLCVSNEQEDDLSEMLLQAFNAWIDKHGLQPKFWRVDEIRKTLFEVSE